MNLTLVKSSLPYLIVLMGVFGAVNNLTAQKLPSGYQSEHQKVQVVVSPQVELISVIQAIGNYRDILLFLISDLEFSYKEHVLEHFSPFTEMDRDMIMPYSENFESLPENARQGVCGEWEECINEFIIRAITTWLARQESETLGDWAYQREKSRGVAYLDVLLEKIEAYQNNRIQYPTLKDYYPKLLKVFMDSNH